MKPQIRVPISFDLDLVRADRVVTSDNKIVMLRVDREESAVAGWMMIAHLDGEALECVSFKNGKDGRADVVDLEKQQTVLIKGDIQAFLCVPHKSGDKVPKVEVFISDKELAEV